MKQRVMSAEKENEQLRKKLEEMEKMNQKQAENTTPPLACVAAAAPVNQVQHMAFSECNSHIFLSLSINTFVLV